MLTTIRALLLLLLALTPVTAAGAESADEVDLTGAWTMTIAGKAPPGKNYASLAFEQQGDQTTVTLSGKAGELETPCEVDGAKLRFEHLPPGKKASVVVFSGEVRGDLMGGEVDMGKRGKSSWQAIREGEEVFDLSGTWTFFQKGLPRDYTNLTKLHFHQDGPDLVATFITGDVETVCEGFLDGDSLGFEYSRTTADGGQIEAKYTGRISGDVMRGEVTLDGGAKSTWQATRDDG